MGLMDGPGIRFVVFLQGCNLRCSYCHNPDTWERQGGILMEPLELMKEISRYRPYFDASDGGVTFSGGEPLLQPEFLLEMLQLCREAGIHTALDTAGAGIGHYGEILSLTDLVILDLKHCSNAGYQEVTGVGMEAIRPFLQALRQSSAAVWIRHVVVPGLTDTPEHILALQELIQTLTRVEKIELIPYHDLGEHKYAQMGLKYKLAGTEPPSEEQIKFLQELLSF
jgi:pyruvate formate lyase activating enzyme